MLTGVLIFLIAVLALLAIPIAFEFRVAWPGAARSEVVLVWALGLLRFRLPTDRAEETPTAEKSLPESVSLSGKTPPNVWAAVRQRPFRQRLYRLGRDLWYSIGKENVRVRARIGLGDPADTGQLWAAFGPVAGLLANVKDISMLLEPDFDDATFEFDGRGKVQLVPLRIIGILLGFLFSPVIWRGMRSMRTD